MQLFYTQFLHFRALLPALLLCISYEVLAQPDPIRWDDIRAEDFNPPPASLIGNQNAVVLCDYGTSSYEDIGGALQLVYHRHTRLLIISKEGQQYANVRILVREKFNEHISDLKAQSINLTGGNRLEKNNLDKSNLLKEEINEDVSSWTFTIPEVHANTIIEYSYNLISSDLFNYRSWQFQKTIPVVWSEYRAEIGGLYNYMAVLHNISGPLTHNEKKDSTVLVHAYQLGVTEGPNEYAFRKTYGRWVMSEVPGLQTEAFVNAPADALMEIRFQLYSLTRPGQKPIPFVKEWNDIGRILMDDDRMGKQLLPDRIYRQLSREIVLETDSPHDRTKKIYNWFKSNYRWNGIYSIRASIPVNALNTARTGNSADMNIFLINLLREAGVDANPVLISTISNGKVQKEVPLLSQFNKLICAVSSKDDKILVDACDPLLPFGMLPLEDMNNLALVINKDHVEWLPIPEPKNSLSLSTHIFRFTRDGSLTGSVLLREDGYKAIESLHRIQKLGLSEFAKEIADRITFGLNVDSFRLLNQSERQDSLVFQLSFTSHEWMHQFDNMQRIYFDAFLTGEFKDNPFRPGIRINPIEFPYPFDLIQQVIIEIPEGYEVEEVPGAERMILSQGAMQYTFSVSHTEEVVQLQTRLMSKKRSYPAALYEEIQSFFELVSSKYYEHIVAGLEEN